MKRNSQTLRVAAAVVIILGTVVYLAVSGAKSNKSYYVTIGEMRAMGSKAYTRHLRVAGNVAPGSVERSGSKVNFVLVEQGHRLTVNYLGDDPPPDTFKDDAQALAIGTLGRDGVFQATQLQAKCASKYAPANKPGASTASLTPLAASQ
ncbi:cytochrome c-type biogenesis protein CcmE [Silvibacterium bohemicum]|uniref:Cytochrome c-type biogenesis protein CcmE n=1 Tax=Silvibacterium bohemicum TaxID=1577686 RepID=A0A841JTP8_9BACT|nr:cytochrome c maturation protein CcmE [Silvibacterium bohemicum]MBB6143857.1 cytochrome c-type biogenesis protein CcmE [Silvibacterium bohemicum]